MPAPPQDAGAAAPPPPGSHFCQHHPAPLTPTPLLAPCLLLWEMLSHLSFWRQKGASAAELVPSLPSPKPAVGNPKGGYRCREGLLLCFAT